MFRVVDEHRAMPLHLQASTRQIEQQRQSVLPPHTLMQRAGAALARLALAAAPHARHIWIATGPGNNGGDGLEAAALLQAPGRDIHVTLAANPQDLPEDARRSLGRALAAGVRLVNASDSAAPPERVDLAVDALLGIGGGARRPEGALADLIDQLNALPCPVLAVDLPSGLHGDTGQAFDGGVVQASHTLSLLTLKPGLYTGLGRDCAGDIWLDTLGNEPTMEPADAWLHGREPGPLVRRRHAQHKGSFGDVGVVGGARGMTGAARLAARAAHAAGAGRVYVSLLDPQAAAQEDFLRPELMYRGIGADSAKSLFQATVVCGCGGGDDIRRFLPGLLSSTRRLVVDADALNAIATDPQLMQLLQRRSGQGRDTILTPHPLEAARLLGCQTAEVQADRLHAARLLAAQTRCVVVLKGSGSVICAPQQLARINSTGNAALASAGTGDVLAGWIGGLWAQPFGVTASALDVATWAVAQHGAAAEPNNDGGPLRASDLIERLHQHRQGPR